MAQMAAVGMLPLAAMTRAQPHRLLPTPGLSPRHCLQTPGPHSLTSLAIEPDGNFAGNGGAIPDGTGLISWLWTTGCPAGLARLTTALVKTEGQKVPFRMSALGQKRSFASLQRNVRFTPKADIARPA
jgi:hypothetical protein